MTVDGVTQHDERPTGPTSSATSPVFTDDVETAPTSGTLAVLAHRAVNTLSSAGLAVALVRAHASQSGDTEAISACNEMFGLIDQAARIARDRIILRSHGVIDLQTRDIRAS